MSESSCGVSSCGSNSGGITDNYRMAGSSGSCSFIKQERIDSENFTGGESRSNPNLELNRQLQIVIAGAERTSGINLESGVVLSDRYIHVVIKIDMNNEIL